MIIGGGFIGLELAENLRHRGMDVTLLERGPHIMSLLDAEMAAIVAGRMQAEGVTILTHTEATEITPTGVIAGPNNTFIPADVVVAAIGVRPAAELADAAGLAIGRGIKVDEFQRTSDPHIYALGDAAEKRDAIDGADTLIPLAQTANRHGRLVADIITGRKVTSQPTLGTAIVGLFGLAAATVGWNERRARAAGKTIRVIHLHPANHARYYPGAATLHMKLVIDADTDAILGAQIVGEEGVDKRIDIIAVVMRAGLKARDLADLELAYAPQFGSAKDPINLAGFIDDNLLAGERTVQWHELKDMQARGATLIDVRTPEEFTRGAIPGAINIPVDELRGRLNELRPLADAGIIVHCQVGLRGHVAVSRLRNVGIPAVNLDGGFLTWSHGHSALVFRDRPSEIGLPVEE